MNSIENEFRTLCLNGITAGTVAPSKIKHAEKSLGVVFPAQYRAFLEEFGAILVQGVEIYGITEPNKNAPLMWQEVVDVTQQLRNIKQAGTEDRNLVPISDDGMGVYFFLNTKKYDNAEILAIGAGVEAIVAANLHEFVTTYSLGKLMY